MHTPSGYVYFWSICVPVFTSWSLYGSVSQEAGSVCSLIISRKHKWLTYHTVRVCVCVTVCVSVSVCIHVYVCGSNFLNTVKSRPRTLPVCFSQTDTEEERVNHCACWEAVIWSWCLESNNVSLWKLYCFVCVCILTTFKLSKTPRRLDPWQRSLRSPE